jgi:hypothetical protein
MASAMAKLLTAYHDVHDINSKEGSDAMNLEMVMQELEALSKERSKKMYISNGAHEPLFGVAIGEMKPSFKKGFWNILSKYLRIIVKMLCGAEELGDGTEMA